MRVEKDFEQFIKSLKENGVKYCIVGAYAVAFHGHTRATKDMDILVEPSVDNARKIISSIEMFFNNDLGLKPDDFTGRGKFIQLGYAPNRIDIITDIPGVDFRTVWKNRVKSRYGNQETYFIGLNELIKSKKVSKRPADKDDIEYLQRAKKGAICSSRRRREVAKRKKMC